MKRKIRMAMKALLTTSCKMDFDRFPMDVHSCSMVLSSQVIYTH